MHRPAASTDIPVPNLAFESQEKSQETGKKEFTGAKTWEMGNESVSPSPAFRRAGSAGPRDKIRQGRGEERNEYQNRRKETNHQKQRGSNRGRNWAARNQKSFSRFKKRISRTDRDLTRKKKESRGVSGPPLPGRTPYAIPRKAGMRTAAHAPAQKRRIRVYGTLWEGRARAGEASLEQKRERFRSGRTLEKVSEERSPWGKGWSRGKRVYLPSEPTWVERGRLLNYPREGSRRGATGVVKKG